MKHPERKEAKRYDNPGRCAKFTDLVYSGSYPNKSEMVDRVRSSEMEFDPPKSEYNVYYGEMHGHTNLSDGDPNVDIDTYFTNLRDIAKLDFAAVADHDHGGIGNEPLFGSKWELIKRKVKQYYEPGKFTTILAYERDSYPWYNNMVVYYDNHDGEMLRGIRDGEITKEELVKWLKRKDVLLVPHDCNMLNYAADFWSIDTSLMTPLMEICSRGESAEYFDHPLMTEGCCEGGSWQDALSRGARMGVIGASDDHQGTGGRIIEEYGYPRMYPGITGVLAKDNTLPSIFEALRARRCYAFLGGRIELDFRINGHYMGEEFATNEDRAIWFNVKADAPIDRITIVKNCRDIVIIKNTNRKLIFDYRPEQEVDYYYIRVQLTDGRWAWSSPIWIRQA